MLYIIWLSETIVAFVKRKFFPNIYINLSYCDRNIIKIIEPKKLNNRLIKATLLASLVPIKLAKQPVIVVPILAPNIKAMLDFSKTIFELESF